MARAQEVSSGRKGSRRRPLPTKRQVKKLTEALADNVYEVVQQTVDVGELIFEYSKRGDEEYALGRDARDDLQDAYMSLRAALEKCERAARKLE